MKECGRGVQPGAFSSTDGGPDINISNESPVDEEHFLILTSDRPSSTPEEAMGLVLPLLPEYFTFGESKFESCKQ